MTKKYHDTEYLYLSACIHSWETRLLTPERREQLLSAPTDRDAARVVDVRVGDEQNVDVAGVEGEHGVVQLVAPLL